MSPKSRLFYGAVINPTSITNYGAFPNCLISVGASGNVEWIIEEVPKAQLYDTLSEKGFTELDVVAFGDGEFLMPGFIDTHTVSFLHPPLSLPTC